MESVFRALEAADDHDCAKMFLCQLAAREPSAHTEQESQLMKLFPSTVAKKEVSLTSAKTSFDLAAALGYAVKGNEDACVDRFELCGADFTFANWEANGL